MSNPAIDVTKMDLGPCMVSFDGTDLGATLGNVVVTWKYLKSQFKADQYGQTVLDSAISGIDISITTELAEIKNKAVWSVVFPHATVVGTTTKALHFNDKMTVRDLGSAKILILHPMANGATDYSQDFKFLLAVSTEESSYSLSPTEQQKLKIVWRIYPDMTSLPAQYFVYGDPSIT